MGPKGGAAEVSTGFQGTSNLFYNTLGVQWVFLVIQALFWELSVSCCVSPNILSDRPLIQIFDFGYLLWVSGVQWLLDKGHWEF